MPLRRSRRPVRQRGTPGFRDISSVLPAGGQGPDTGDIAHGYHKAYLDQKLMRYMMPFSVRRGAAPRGSL